MDEMKINVNTSFMQGMLSKLLAKMVSKKIGFKPEIELNELNVELKNGKLNFHLSLNGSIDEKAFAKINHIIDEM